MMSATDTVRILTQFARLGVRIWVDGGWGIDALIGEQTRPHADLDLAIDTRDQEAIIRALAAAGFAVTEDQRPTRFVLHHPDGRQIDVHPLVFDTAGGGTQILPDGSTFRYTPEGLSGMGEIDGVPVRCLTAELQLRCHLGYLPDADDHHDMRLLRDRLGITLPPPYDAPA